MKTNITKAGTMMMMASLFFMGAAVYAQPDLSIGNIDAGWDTYNSSTGIITGVYFDVLNNENDAADDFDVEIYLINPGDFTDRYTVYVNHDDGQSGNTVVTYQDIDINFNDTPGIPAGEYRLGVCVDPGDDITETDESNNCLYISTSGNNLTYNPGTMSIPAEEAVNGIRVYPNPAYEKISFMQENGLENASVCLMDASGKMVRSVLMNVQLTEMDLSGLAQGLYFYQVINKDGQVTGRGKIIKK